MAEINPAPSLINLKCCSPGRLSRYQHHCIRSFGTQNVTELLHTVPIAISFL